MRFPKNAPKVTYKYPVIGGARDGSVYESDYQLGKLVNLADPMAQPCGPLFATPTDELVEKFTQYRLVILASEEGKRIEVLTCLDAPAMLQILVDNHTKPARPRADIDRLRRLELALDRLAGRIYATPEALAGVRDELRAILAAAGA